MADNEEKAREYYDMGIAQYQQDDVDKAIEYFTEAIKFAPDWGNVYDSRGIAYSTKGEYDKAIADFNGAIRINPKESYYYYHRGLAYGGKGDLNQYITDCTEAIRIDEIDSRLKDVSSINQGLKTAWAKIYNDRGVAYAKMKNYKQAIADYEAALLLDPNEELYRNNLDFYTKASMGVFARFWLTFRRRIIIGGIIGAIIAILSLVSSNPFSQGISNGILTVIIIFVMFVVLGGIVGFILPFIFKVISLFTGKGK